MNNSYPKSNDDIAKEFGIIAFVVMFAVFLIPIIILGIPISILVNFIHSIKLRILMFITSLIIFTTTIYFNFIDYFGYVGYLVRNYDFTMLSFIEKMLGQRTEITNMSYLLYVTGALIFALVLSFYKDISNKKIIKTKLDEKERYLNSSQYKKILKNKIKINEKFQEKYRKEKPSNKVLLGITQKGKKLEQPFVELNQHALLSATTGGGKTVLLTTFIEHAARNNIPMLFIDGKGSKSTIDDVKTVLNAYGKKLRVFSEFESMTYNPIKYGNATQISDKLLQLVQTESEYYSNINVALIQPLIDFLDEYGIERNLHNLAYYLDPEKIKDIINNDVEIVEEKKIVKKKIEQSNEDKSNDIVDLLNLDSDQSEEQSDEQYEEVEKTFKKSLMTDRASKFQERFFTRYIGTKEGEYHLFANADTLRVVLFKLIESEIGHLFVESDNELDLIEAQKNNEYIFVSFDGSIYSDFIKIIARFLILDINNMVSVVNRGEIEKKPFLLVCDEFSVYCNEKIIDTVNKSREAKVHAIIAVQTIFDLEDVSPTFTKRVIENTNTHYIGQTNAQESIDLWSKMLGTYKDKELTHVTEKSDRSFINRIDKTEDRGTVRTVDRFNIDPNVLRSLGQGEFVIHSKASKEKREPMQFFARYPLKFKSRSDNN